MGLADNSPKQNHSQAEARGQANVTNIYHQPNSTVKPEPWTSDRLGWLALCSFDGFGPRTLRKLYMLFGQHGQEALMINTKILSDWGCNVKTIEKFLEYRQTINPADQAQKLSDFDLRFILCEESEYPSLLSNIADPPIALFVRGEKISSDNNLIAIVGTRSATSYGRTIASALIQEFVKAKLGIVSGLALGIDAIAHENALQNNGYCLAVLGSGADDQSIYPRHNFRLAQNILRHQGTIISEYPPRTEAFKYNFPMRNRIISGLCRATIVIEATEDSGSLITAHQALEQNRDVFAVPGPINSAQSKGTNMLIKQGAIPCLCGADVIESVFGVKQNTNIATINLQNFSKEEVAIIMELKEPRHLDDLKRISELGLSQLSVILSKLEMNGIVINPTGKIFSLSPQIKV